ncbi:hypothetical protein Tco_1295359 [Tanacetum coccineum]
MHKDTPLNMEYENEVVNEKIDLDRKLVNAPRVFVRRRLVEGVKERIYKLQASLLLREYKAEAIRLMSELTMRTQSRELHSLKSELIELHQRLEFPFTTMRVRVFSDL